jgi:hypothetical protein
VSTSFFSWKKRRAQGTTESMDALIGRTPGHQTLIHSLAMEEVILCAWEKHPEQRFRTAWALARAYQEARSIPDTPTQAMLSVRNAGPMTLLMKPRWTAFQTPFPQLTKHPLRGLIIVFVVLPLLLIMYMVSLGAIILSAQHTTIHAASSHAIPAVNFPPWKINRGSEILQTSVPRGPTPPKRLGCGYRKGNQTGNDESP